MKKSSAVAVERKKKGRKQSRNKKRKIKRFLLFILITTAIVLFALSPVFVVKNINVEGNKKYRTDDIIEQTGLEPGQNVFKMLFKNPKDLIGVRFKLSEESVLRGMPYVKSVSVRPAFAAGINIKIEERSPYCIADVNGTSILIDDGRYALDVANSPEQKKKYFSVVGISADGYKLGQEVKFNEEDLFEDLKLFCDSLKENDKDKDSKMKLYDKIKSVDLSEPNELIVNFDSRLYVKFGDLENISYKIRFLKAIYVNNIIANKKGTLDFTKSSNPHFEPAE